MKNKIITIKRYICGQEEFNFQELFLNTKYQTETLPINVFLIEHKKYGNLLINTGCTKLLKKNAIQYSALKNKRKISFDDNSSIMTQLEADDMDPLCIKKVLLTHCDPECCGALPLLPKYEILSSAQVLCVLHFAYASEGVMKSTLPPKKINRAATGLFNGETLLKNYFKWIYDVLGDGSVLGVDLSGHAKAMMGFFIPEHNIFFAADTAIDERILDEELVPNEKLLSLQFDPNDYLSSLATLRRLHRENPDIRLFFSHSICDDSLLYQ